MLSCQLSVLSFKVCGSTRRKIVVGVCQIYLLTKSILTIPDGQEGVTTTIFGTEHEYIPSHFKKGIIIPIPKGKISHVRIITEELLSYLSLQRCMECASCVNREEKSKQVKGKIDTLKGITADKCSSLHSAWLLKEAIM